jgi:hypothetical protein
MIPFDDLCPEEAAQRILVIRSIEPGQPLPVGEYGFFEFYCEEDGCDCRRVLLEVHSPQIPGEILATINYGWESVQFYSRRLGGDTKSGREITQGSLDPLNANSDLAEAVLDAFRGTLRQNPQFVENFKAHYGLFKQTLKNRNRKAP